MSDLPENEWVTGSIKISVYGEPIEMEMTVPAKPVKLKRMLPILQMMTNSFMNVGEESLKMTGEKISCKEGCGACCRQAVPLSEVEAYQLAEMVENMDEPRRSEIKKRFADGVKFFHEKKWFERMNHYGDLDLKARETLVMEYFYENVACPFLENESCSIHTERPLTCREYLVTNPAEFCANPTAQTIKTVGPLIKFSESVRQVAWAGHLDKSKINFVPLIRALEWAEIYSENAPEKSGQEWMGEIFSKISDSEIPQNKAETKGD